MDITLEQKKLQILRLLGDEQDPNTGLESPDYGDYAVIPLGGMTYNADLLLDAVHAALDALATRFWKSATQPLTKDLTEFELPDDLIDIEGVRDLSTGTFLPKVQILAGRSPMEKSANAWSEYPSGKLTLINPLGSQGGTLFYSATWARLESDSDLLEPPINTSTAISFFAVSYCLLNQASQSGSLAQFRTKVDAGKPTDNPLIDLSNAFMRRYEMELQRIPLKEKGIPS